MKRLKHRINDMVSFLKLPSNVEQIFQEESIRKNSLTMKFLAAFMIVVEIFNICRVLFFTNGKLSTVNNQIYFTMYVMLLTSAIVFTLIEWKLQNKHVQRVRLYVATSYFWMLWHVVLNCYDLIRNPNGDITLFSSAVLGLAIFAHLKPRHTLTIATLAYMVLLIFSGTALDAGAYINATISLILAFLVALRVYMLSIVQIQQHIEIDKQSKQLEKERTDLKSSLEKYETVLNNTNDYIFDIDFHKDKLIFAQNSRIAKHFGSEISNVTTWLKTQNIIHPEYVSQLIQAMRELSTTKREGDYTFRLRSQDGTDKWYQLRVFVTGNHNDATIKGVGIISDIDVQYKQVELLTSKANTDPLTGLFNTSAFKHSYAISLGKLRENEHIVMFMMDLDNFKAINDTYGHFAGDCVLKNVSTVLKATFREHDFTARLGGDEFAVIMNNVKDIRSIEKKAEQLTDELSKIEVTESKIHVSCSIGIAVSSNKQLQYDDLYKSADKLLYQAKSDGKKRYKMIIQ